MLHNPTELVCAGLQYSRTDDIRACSFIPAQSLQLSLNLVVRDRQAGSGGVVEGLVLCCLVCVLGGKGKSVLLSIVGEEGIK